MLTGGQKNETSREEQTLSPGSLNGSIRLWEAGLEGSCTGGLGSSERLLQDPRAPAWLAMDLAGGGGGRRQRPGSLSLWRDKPHGHRQQGVD